MRKIVAGIMVGLLAVGYAQAAPSKKAKTAKADETLVSGCSLVQAKYVAADGSVFPNLMNKQPKLKGSVAATMASLSSAIAEAESRLSIPDSSSIAKILGENNGKVVMQHKCKYIAQAGLPAPLKFSQFPAQGEETKCNTNWVSFVRNRTVSVDADGEEHIVNYYLFEGLPNAITLDDSPLTSLESENAKAFINMAMSGKPMTDADLLMLKSKTPSMGFASSQACNVVTEVGENPPKFFDFFEKVGQNPDVENQSGDAK